MADKFRVPSFSFGSTAVLRRLPNHSPKDTLPDPLNAEYIKQRKAMTPEETELPIEFNANDFLLHNFVYSYDTRSTMANLANSRLREFFKDAVTVYGNHCGRLWDDHEPDLDQHGEKVIAEYFSIRPKTHTALLVGIKPIQKPMEIKLDTSMPPQEFHVIDSAGRRHKFKLETP